MSEHTDSCDWCDWCGQPTNAIQIKAGTPNVGLCPSCCPDVDADEVPDNAPSSWFHMSDEERQDWQDGLSLEEIMEKYEWMVPPDTATTP